jgi:hypothetical protein
LAQGAQELANHPSGLTEKAMLPAIDIGMPKRVPKWTLIVLASIVFAPHYKRDSGAENDNNHELICRIEKDPGV